MPDTNQTSTADKEASGQKRTLQEASKCNSEHIEVNVVENGGNIAGFLLEPGRQDLNSAISIFVPAILNEEVLKYLRLVAQSLWGN